MSRSMSQRLRRGTIWRGRRWSVARYERRIERRAGSWFGIGPAREDSPRFARGRTYPGGSWEPVPDDTLVLLDVPPTELNAAGRVIGVAVHAGRWQWLALWQPVGIRGTVRRSA